jgi:competence protein ComFC
MNVHWLKWPVEGMLQLLYPPLCLICQNPVEEFYLRAGLCRNCCEELSPVDPAFIRNDILARLQPCFLDELVVCFEFNSSLQTVIHQIKYGKFEKLGWHMGQLAAESLNTPVLFPHTDIIIPVPLHPARQKERGFNQSQSIAGGLFNSRKKLIVKGALIRARSTRTQTELDRQERRENVQEAFSVKKPQIVDGNEIVLVDDVVTTGATLNECACVLKKNGAVVVNAITLATPVT